MGVGEQIPSRRSKFPLEWYGVPMRGMRAKDRDDGCIPVRTPSQNAVMFNRL